MYFLGILWYYLLVSNSMTTTYYATEISPEEYTATLAEAAELAFADYQSHLDEQDVRIGDVVKDERSGEQLFYRVSDIVDEQWYSPLVMLERLTSSGWKPTRVRFHELHNPVKAKPRKLQWFLSAVPVGALFKSAHHEKAGLMQRVEDTEAGTLRARILDGQFAGEVICKSKHSRVYAL